MATKTLTSTIKLTPKDVAEILSSHFEKHFNSPVNVKFNCTTEYDQMDRGPGSPVLASVEVQGSVELNMNVVKPIGRTTGTH